MPSQHDESIARWSPINDTTEVVKIEWMWSLLKSWRESEGNVVQKGEKVFRNGKKATVEHLRGRGVLRATLSSS